MSLAGCFQASVQPRTAALARPGDVTSSADLIVYTHAPGEVTVDDGSVHPGNLGYLQPIETITGVLGWLGSSSVHFELGLGERVAANASLGFQRTSLELRTSFLDERRGAPLSVAAAAGLRIGAAGFLEGARAGGAQAGFDVSRALGGSAVFTNLYVTWASELYMRNVGVLPDRDCYGSCDVAFVRRAGQTPCAFAARPSSIRSGPSKCGWALHTS